MDLGGRLARMRYAKGLGLREAAKLLGISASYLSDIEHNRRDVSANMADGLCRLLDLDYAVLRAWTGHLPLRVREGLFALDPCEVQSILDALTDQINAALAS